MTQVIIKQNELSRLHAYMKTRGHDFFFLPNSSPDIEHMVVVGLQ